MNIFYYGGPMGPVGNIRFFSYDINTSAMNVSARIVKKSV